MKKTVFFKTHRIQLSVSIKTDILSFHNVVPSFWISFQIICITLKVSGTLICWWKQGDGANQFLIFATVFWFLCKWSSTWVWYRSPKLTTYKVLSKINIQYNSLLCLLAHKVILKLSSCTLLYASLKKYFLHSPVWKLKLTHEKTNTFLKR